MVDTIERIPKLHMICGEVDGGRADLQNLTLFYFMRTTDVGVPAFDSYKECLEEITKYLIVGSIQGKFLLSLNKMLVQLFKPSVESQFRGPKFADPINEADSDDDEPNFANLIESRSSIFRRPSEFRRASMIISKKADDTETDEDEKEGFPKSAGLISNRRVTTGFADDEGAGKFRQIE
ncbi:uncharacterized protein LOC143376572 [Andrena cerasifolii]|uniref:uncharacterized protein LOC143376572 n=1 Tax=Andrena cerasifolii TaxID=2819439 RepID=UPI004037B826